MTNADEPKINNEESPASIAGDAGSLPNVSRQQVLSGAPALSDTLLGKELVGRYKITQVLGTGAMGIEALSRGAARATFVDSSPAAIRAISSRPGKAPRERSCSRSRGYTRAACPAS